jgi:hypothetical protein
MACSGRAAALLRGHHLICLHFFRGEGYDRRFIENLSSIVSEAEGGESVTVVEGPDDVCAACPYLKDGGCGHEGDSEGAIMAMDADALRLLDARMGDDVSWLSIKRKLEGIMPEWKKLYCRDCAWLKACLKDPTHKGKLNIPSSNGPL